MASCRMSPIVCLPVSACDSSSSAAEVDCRLTLGRQELRVLEGHGGVGGQHLEQALVLLVELPVPEAGEHDHAHDVLAR